MARATWATLRLCVRRLCSSPEPLALTTWVTPPSRAKNGDATIRSRSTRNGLAARSPDPGPAGCSERRILPKLDLISHADDPSRPAS